MKIVICGSMSAAEQMVKMENALKQLGHEVILPRNTANYASRKLKTENNRESANNKIAHDLLRRYYSYIKEADAIVVANYDKGAIKNYIGGNSFLEAGFAHVLNKKLYFMNDIPEMLYSDELFAFQPIILHGDLSKIK